MTQGATATKVAVPVKPVDVPVSTLAMQIVQAALKPDASVADLGKIAENDPAFVLRVLSVVNSAAYGFGRKITDMKHAAGLLGLKELKNIALGLLVFDMAPLGGSGDSLLGVCLRRAVTARTIAEAIGERKVDEFFSAGLLLEFGLLLRARTDLAGAVAVASAPATSRTVQERAAGEEDHPERGSRFAREWRLPEEVVDAIANHHHPEPPPERKALVCWISERVAAVYEGGDLIQNHQDAVQALAKVGIKEEAAKGLIKELPKKVEEAAVAFQREMPQQDIDLLMKEATSSLAELNKSYQGLIHTLEKIVAEKDALAQSLEKANQDLRRLAMTDGLTGLYNRRAFAAALAKDLSRADRARTTLSLVMIDIDHFKSINDTKGHQTGDAVLRGVAEVLIASIRGGDLAGRYGGEEFCLVLPDTNLDGAMIVAERIRVSVEQKPFQGPQGSFHVTASFGVANITGPGCANSAEALIKKADEALYKAKADGRNRVIKAAG